uniref:RRM domain-containing protein n=1 Tax=Trichuris muris TaxID=70415 RepID=A0A5S6Q727_TRIMR
MRQFRRLRCLISYGTSIRMGCPASPFGEFAYASRLINSCSCFANLLITFHGRSSSTVSILGESPGFGLRSWPPRIARIRGLYAGFGRLPQRSVVVGLFVFETMETLGQYLRVCEEEGDDEIVEVPLETDGTVLLSTLAGMMPGACGLKFRNPDTGAFRGLRIEDGHIYCEDVATAKDTVFYAVFPKENTKRKMEDFVESSAVSKLKKVERRKCTDLIVLGIPYQLGEDELRDYFEQYGDVVMAQVKRDMRTGKSKGYGFIRFHSYDAQLTVIAKKHWIEGRWCEVKIPYSKLDPLNPSLQKVFVGRLTESITEQDLIEFFSTRGEVLDAFIPKPFRGFGFVTFSSSEVAQSMCGQEFVINGNNVRCCHAIPKENAALKNGGALAEQVKEAVKYRNPLLSHYSSLMSTDGWQGAVIPPGAIPTQLRKSSANSATSSNSMSATNQATVGMGALNLGSLITPAVWAAAHVALYQAFNTTSAQASAAQMPSTDLGSLLGSLQSAANQISQCNVTPSTPVVSKMAQNAQAAATWWSGGPNAVTTVPSSVQSVCPDIRASGDPKVGSTRVGRNLAWATDDDWRT